MLVFVVGVLDVRFGMGLLVLFLDVVDGLLDGLGCVFFWLGVLLLLVLLCCVLCVLVLVYVCYLLFV